MEEKKLLNEELEKVTGGFGNHIFEFGSPSSDPSIPENDMNVSTVADDPDLFKYFLNIVDSNITNPSSSKPEPVDCSGLIP